MVRIIHALAIAAFVATASACALDDGLVDEAEASEPLDESVDESVAAPATDEEAELAAPDQVQELASDSGEEAGEFEAAACRPTFHDGCQQAHQGCHCQNTGWAGFCAWELDGFCPVLFCHCD